jgi:hypothetical protein
VTIRYRSRIGSDDARAWVRKLRLGNPYAKAILMAVANYMNENGTAYPGVATLREDTDIAEDTIVSRLRWCESIGAIALFKAWVDENGQRNLEGRGRVTSSEIRFLFDADPELIATAAAENSRARPLRGAALASHEEKVSSRHDGEQNDDISSRPQREQNEVSSRLAPEQPPTPAARSLKEEEDSPPNPPPGGGQAVDLELERDLMEASNTYPAPITDMPKFRAVMGALSREERQRVLTGMRGYADYIRGLERKGKSRNVKDAHRWVAAGMWQGYVPQGARAEAAALAQTIPIKSDAGKALVLLHQIGIGTGPLEIGGCYQNPRPLSPQALALTNAPPEEEWIFITTEQPHQVRAWNDLIGRELIGRARPPLIRKRYWPCIRRIAEGCAVPWPWPPRKDGTIISGHDPPSELAHLSDEELAEFK